MGISVTGLLMYGLPTPYSEYECPWEESGYAAEEWLDSVMGRDKHMLCVVDIGHIDQVCLVVAVGRLRHTWGWNDDKPRPVSQLDEPTDEERADLALFAERAGLDITQAGWQLAALMS